MRIRSAWVIAAMMALTACVTKPEALEILDQQSGNTFFVASKPLVFARERTDVAAHSRDYAMLVAVAVDESGTFSEYLLLHRWSTVDRRMLEPARSDAGQLRILAEGRSIELAPLGTVPVTLSSRPELRGPEHSDVITRAYRVDLATLRFVAASRVLAVRLPQEPLDTDFSLWTDGRASLAKFVDAQGLRER